MSEERTKLEIIAPSVEEAVEKGLRDLGLTEDDVDIEVLDEGKKGLLGLGSRQARIALKIKGASETKEKTEKKQALVETHQALPEEVDESKKMGAEPEEVSIARETINIILEKMRVTADVSVRLGESDDNRVQPVLIDIEGKDLSFLIGRKAETINALQFVTSPDIDLILLDLGLPDVDGQTLLGMLRRNYGLTDLPIIVCTAWPPDAAKKMAEAYGFDDYISKPYKVLDFMEVVNKFLEA